MERTIFKTGNSHAVSLPAELMRAYGLQNGSRVQVRADPERGGILITPVTPVIESVDAEFVRLIDEFIEEYRPALEALARR